MYRIFRDNTGKVDAINRMSDGASLPYNLQSKMFDESHPLVIELREWERTNGKLDLSDRTPPLPPPPEANWAGVLDAVRGTALFGKVYVASKSNVETNTVFTLLLTALTNPFPNLPDFIFALQELQNVMGSAMTNEDINTINTALKNNNFDFQLKQRSISGGISLKL